MRVTALLTAYNEELVMGPVLEHLIGQGVEVYVVDNESTDRTVEIARSYLGRGVLGVETLSRQGSFDLVTILQNEERLARELPGDWFIHHDADEMRVAPPPYQTLKEGLEAAERSGYNAVEFQEFVFVPTKQEPNHEHEDFRRTMRHYYHYAPKPLHRLNAWKRAEKAFTLREGGSAHRVDIPGMRVFPRAFWLKHYICLSREHAIRKYCQRQYSSEEIERGWHRKRAALRPEDIYLPDQSELQEVGECGVVDTTRLRKEHLLFQGARRCR